MPNQVESKRITLKVGNLTLTIEGMESSIDSSQTKAEFLAAIESELTTTFKSFNPDIHALYQTQGN